MHFLINGNQILKRTQTSKVNDKPEKNKILNDKSSSLTSEKKSSSNIPLNNNTHTYQNVDITRELFQPFYQNFMSMPYYSDANYANDSHESRNNSIVNPILIQNYPANILYSPQLQQIPQNQQYVFYFSDIEQFYQLFQSQQK
jgi:hypothetical protein